LVRHVGRSDSQRGGGGPATRHGANGRKKWKKEERRRTGLTPKEGGTLG